MVGCVGGRYDAASHRASYVWNRRAFVQAICRYLESIDQERCVLRVVASHLGIIPASPVSN